MLLLFLLPLTQSNFTPIVVQRMDDVVNMCVDVLNAEASNEGENRVVYALHSVRYDSKDETIDVNETYHEILLREEVSKVSRKSSLLPFTY